MSFRPTFGAFQEIADAILAQFADPTLAAEFKKGMKNYHGFWKRTLPKELWAQAAAAAGLGECELQVELVELVTENRHETHLHRKSGALVVILEAQRGWSGEFPREARAYLDGEWKLVQAGDVIEILPGKVHGFTVGHMGLLRFLSIQYPPISSKTHDDYVRVSV